MWLLNCRILHQWRKAKLILICCSAKSVHAANGLPQIHWSIWSIMNWMMKISVKYFSRIQSTTRIVNGSNEEIMYESTLLISLSCRTIINETIITVSRHPATEFLFRNFLDDQSILEQHLNRIEKPLSQQTRDILLRYINHSKTRSDFITLRILLLLNDEQSMWEYGLNRSHRLDYRAIALRSLKNTSEFHEKLRAMFEDKEESYEIRLIALQSIVPMLKPSDIAHWIETVESKQIGFYLNSLLKQSSIWKGHSGSYVFPFGTISVIFDEHVPSFLPNIVQIELEAGTDIDLYWIKNNNSVRSR